MEPKTYELDVDIEQSIYLNKIVQYSSRDYDKCKIAFNISKNGTPYNLDNADLILVLSSNRISQRQACDITADGKAEVTLDSRVLVDSNRYDAELKAYDKDDFVAKRTLARFIVLINKSIDESIDVPDNEMYDNFTILLESTKDIKEDLERKVAEDYYRGAQGIQGVQGIQGIRGEIGPRGEQGIQGPKGEVGPQGIQGPNGDKGESGPQGLTGEQGAQGIQGPSGKDGTIVNIVNGEQTTQVTNVNFIENKIVQDGLVANVTGQGSFSIIGVFRNNAYSTETSPFIYDINWTTFSGFQLYHTSGKSISLAYGNGSSIVYRTIVSNYQLGTDYKIAVIYDGTNLNVMVNEIQVVEKPLMRNINISVNTTTLLNHKKYNRIITKTEINHNLSVLNNSPSISAIETTDSNSNKTSLSLSSNSTHVEMPNGKTLRDFAYETLDWETKTSNGSDINVTNGKKAWVRNAKISGNTVKCIYADKDWVTIAGSSSTWLTNSKPIADAPQLKLSTTYVLLTEIKSNSLATSFAPSYSGTTRPFTKSSQVIEAKQIGIFKDVLITKDSLTDVAELFNSGTQHNGSGTVSITFRRCLIEITDTNLVNGFIPFGLNSTQAIIVNNDLKYPFYKLLEDKTSGTVITLGGVGGVYDYITMNEDGSAILTQNTMKTTLDGTQTVIYNEGMSTGTIAYFSCTMNDECYAPTTVIADKFITKAWVNGDAVEAVFASSSSKKLIYCGVLKTKLTTIDSLGYKSYLQSNPVTIRYQLATPIVTHIPASLVPTIVTEQANTFSVDSAVKPSSLEVTVAVDKVSDLEKRLQVVEAVINTKSNLSLQANYAEDEYNNLINQI